ncbi:MAG TPA: DUF763 domain-containing protein [bacterium]|nr:DUF763 domain-containing protein [bacterium]
MQLKRGIATFTLDTGVCPRWLFERMRRLARSLIEVVVEEFGPDEFVRRLADPVWFQSLGTVLAFDWNASGLTTTLTAALKEAVRGQEKNWGIFICGGKGRTSRKTPEEIATWGAVEGLPESQVSGLIYHSRMAAKVDSALVQDGFQSYHHAFFFTRSGAWTVVPQGMNQSSQRARRYHWFSAKVTDLVCEPHAGIISQGTNRVCLNLTARESERTRALSTELVRASYQGLMKDLRILRRHTGPVSRMVAVGSEKAETVALELFPVEFTQHPVMEEDFAHSRYLKKILWELCQVKPGSYEQLVALPGVGPRTVRALSLVAEVLYGAAPSYRDPARYSFAHGGKDGTPYPVDRVTYDQSIAFFREVVRRMRLPAGERRRLEQKLGKAG